MCFRCLLFQLVFFFSLVVSLCFSRFASSCAFGFSLFVSLVFRFLLFHLLICAFLIVFVVPHLPGDGC